MRSIPFLAIFVACTGAVPPSGDDWQPVSVVDEGSLCFVNQGADVVVEVTAPDCLSSSCSRDLGGTCEASVDGNVVTLTSEIHWEQNVGTDVACTEDCGAATVSCALPALPDGSYTVLIGAEEVELVVPVDGDCAAL